MIINDYCVNVVSRQAVLGDGGEGDALVRAQQSAIVTTPVQLRDAAGDLLRGDTGMLRALLSTALTLDLPSTQGRHFNIFNVKCSSLM